MALDFPFQYPFYTSSDTLHFFLKHGVGSTAARDGSYSLSIASQHTLFSEYLSHCCPAKKYRTIVIGNINLMLVYIDLSMFVLPSLPFRIVRSFAVIACLLKIYCPGPVRGTVPEIFIPCIQVNHKISHIPTPAWLHDALFPAILLVRLVRILSTATSEVILNMALLSPS